MGFIYRSSRDENKEWKAATRISWWGRNRSMWSIGLPACLLSAIHSLIWSMYVCMYTCREEDGIGCDACILLVANVTAAPGALADSVLVLVVSAPQDADHGEDVGRVGSQIGESKGIRFGHELIQDVNLGLVKTPPPTYRVIRFILLEKSQDVFKCTFF